MAPRIIKPGTTPPPTPTIPARGSGNTVSPTATTAPVAPTPSTIPARGSGIAPAPVTQTQVPSTPSTILPRPTGLVQGPQVPKGTSGGYVQSPDLREARGQMLAAQATARAYGVPQEQITDIVEQKEPNWALKGLGKVINFDIVPGKGEFKPVMETVIKPLQTIDVGRRAVLSTMRETGDLLAQIRGNKTNRFGEKAGWSWSDWSDQVSDVNTGFGTLIGKDLTGNKWADRGIGLFGDIFFDPVTWLTAGTGNIVKEVAEQGIKAGVVATTKQTAKATAQQLAKAGDDAARATLEAAAREGVTDSAELASRAALARASAEEALSAIPTPARVPSGPFGVRPSSGATAGLTPAQQEAAQAIITNQRVGPRRVLGARSREELAQIAREVRETAASVGNEYAVATLTDDVIGDIATRGYSALRGPVAEVLGARGGLRFGVGNAKVVLPYTEALGNALGQTFTTLRVGGKGIPITIPGVGKTVKVLTNGFFGSEPGRAIMANITPVGEGGVFGSADVAAMRVALRTGTYNGKKLTGEVANDFVKLLAMDKAFRGLKSQSTTEAQRLLRPVLQDENFFTYSNTVYDLLDNPKITNLLDDTFDAAAASAAVGREVTDAELAVAKKLRLAGDEFYERANFIHQRAQLAAGRGTPAMGPGLVRDMDGALGTIKPLAKNPAWFPHALSDRARRAVSEPLFFNEIGDDVLEALGVDRGYALAGSNLRQLKAGEKFFGYTLKPADVAGGIRRLNEIARKYGKLNYDFFETNAEKAFVKYGEGFARDTAFSEWLYNLAKVTEGAVEGGRTPGSYLNSIVEAEGAGPFAGKGFQEGITQESIKAEFGVRPPSKLLPFVDAATEILSPARIEALNSVPKLKTELEFIRDEIIKLQDDVTKKTAKGQAVFSDFTNQKINDLEQRILDLQRIAPDVPAGYGAAITAEAKALFDSLQNEAAGLRVAIENVPPDKWARTVPLFLDNATAFLQVNAKNYPGLLASPEIKEMISNFRRLEDPAFAQAMPQWYRDTTQMFKGWVTATPGFHIRNGMSNVFFMLSAGADPITMRRARKVYKAYVKFLQKNNLESVIGLGGDEALTKAATDAAKRVLGPGATDDTIEAWLKTPAGTFAQRQAIEELSAGNKTVMDFLVSAEYKALGKDPLGVVNAATDKTIADVLFGTQQSGFGQIGDVFSGEGKLGISGRQQLRTEGAVGNLAEVSRKLGTPLALSRKMGNAVENWSRFALTYDGLAKGLSPEQASARTAKYLIDYQDLSMLDKSIKQVIPFWTWTSRSFPLILESAWANPRAYAIWNSVTRNATDREGMQDQFRPDYLQSSFKLPFGRNIYGSPDFGFQRQEESFGNLTDPGSILASLSPFPRALVEAGINQRFSTGGQVFNPFYQEGTGAQARYVAKEVLPQIGYAGKLGNVGIGAIQALGSLLRLTGSETPQEIANKIAALPQEQIPAPIRDLIGLGKPSYLQEEQGVQTPEASRQALYRFFGLPGYELQDFQQKAAIDAITKRLEEIAARARNK